MAFAIDSKVRGCQMFGVLEVAMLSKVCNGEHWYAITHTGSDTLKSSCDTVNCCCGN